MNWSRLVSLMPTEFKNFANGNLSGDRLYKIAVSKNLGPEVRQLVRGGVVRARQLTRKALKRRLMLS